jgi:hypothetical protein
MRVRVGIGTNATRGTRFGLGTGNGAIGAADAAGVWPRLAVGRIA